MPAMLVLFIYFLVLIFWFIRQAIYCVKGGCSDKSRLILISILAIVISSTIYKPDGIIDFDKLEGDNVLTAGRKGTAGCGSTLHLKANHRFVMRSVCFGIDTIFKEPEYAIDFEFEDFDRDGFKDARLYYMTNVPGIQNLLIYNQKSKSFKEVRNFDRFPDPHKLAKTHLR